MIANTIERDWLHVATTGRGRTYLYLVEVLRYSNWCPVKIGIARDVTKRLAGLSAMGINSRILAGCYEFADGREARALENALIKNFPRAEGFKTREVLNVSVKEIRDFIEARTSARFIPGDDE